MGKQTFTAGQVLTAAEMNSLQENDYNWAVSTKTASYTLAAGDEGTRIVMDSASATTYAVNVVNLHASNTLTVFVNRTDADSDNAGTLRTSSTITVMEVSA